jgi:hypothetical protein
MTAAALAGLVLASLIGAAAGALFGALFFAAAVTRALWVTR